MKKFVLSLLAFAGLGFGCAARQAQDKVLVAYVSMTGTTQHAAQILATVSGGELYEIAPEVRYSAADLDWRDKESRCYVEMHNLKFRPAMVAAGLDIGKYDVIYLGYPIWWNMAPTLVNTFIEAHKLEGKIVIPFATSGGDGIENSVKVLKKTYPEIDWQGGKLLNGADEQSVKAWLNR